MKGLIATVFGAVLLAAACSSGGGSGDGPDPSPTPSASPSPTSICVDDEDLFDEAWIDGDNGDCGTEPEIQAQQVDANTWVLRQSLCTNFEGPFLYLMFGTDKVLLEDTGTGDAGVRGAVETIITAWLAENGRTTIERVIVNSHGHLDHVGGNADFSGQPSTTLVGTGVANVQAFFGIASWPTEIVEYDLGGRILDVIPIPGHEASHIALYDRATGWLLTGDTLYPGRLYVSNFGAYVASLERLVAFAGDVEVCQVMGTHIEMTTTPEEDYGFGVIYHPDEHALPLSLDHLIELRDAAVGMQADPQIEPHDDFIVYPL